MSTSTVHIFPDEDRWAVETDDGRQRVTYPSRGAAIAAGVQIAMAEDAVLMIHGVNEEPSAIDFSECDVPLIN
ncbi:DUF2188 domain-containing protein [Cupriavidus sp. KK10]|uniref:DUF2188 domain-containing protein n=1 Tax=Cupriavidus sp. KK10 TaxID=1478019 RepID=UPI001BACDB4F|nr:DUF2188 domain-containing protein [Cupriavidus sp. KK10]QUN29564.1 DUF2188 domain-containing protein [Cupriavidus sp. KK10]